jgi:hypothetical protein
MREVLLRFGMEIATPEALMPHLHGAIDPGIVTT